MEIVGMFACAALMGLYKGIVVSSFWRWFIVPLGLPEIGVAHSIGIVYLVGVLTMRISTKTDEREDAPFMRVLAAEAVLVAMLHAMGFGISHMM